MKSAMWITYSRYRALAVSLCLAALLLIFTPALQAQEKDDTESLVKNYYLLVEQYEKWRLGLFGGKKYHETMLIRLLNRLVGSGIQTTASYTLVSPADPDKIEIICKVQDCRWLRIRGPVDRESMKALMTGDPDIVKNMWRTNRLVAVKGTIRKYHLGRDRLGDVVTLYLNEIFFVDPGTGREESPVKDQQPGYKE